MCIHILEPTLIYYVNLFDVLYTWADFSESLSEISISIGFPVSRAPFPDTFELAAPVSNAVPPNIFSKLSHSACKSLEPTFV